MQLGRISHKMRFSTALALDSSSPSQLFNMHFGGHLAEWLRFAGVQHPLWKDVSYKMRFRETADARNAVFSMPRVVPNLGSQALGNDGSDHSRIMRGSCSNRPSIATRVFTGFLCTCC